MDTRDLPPNGCSNKKKGCALITTDFLHYAAQSQHSDKAAVGDSPGYRLVTELLVLVTKTK